MMLAGHVLNYRSGKHKFYNPIMDSINISDSLQWNDFKHNDMNLDLSAPMLKKRFCSENDILN